MSPKEKHGNGKIQRQAFYSEQTQEDSKAKTEFQPNSQFSWAGTTREIAISVAKKKQSMSVSHL